LAISNHS
jgi:hypothetical protein